MFTRQDQALPQLARAPDLIHHQIPTLKLSYVSAHFGLIMEVPPPFISQVNFDPPHEIQLYSTLGGGDGNFLDEAEINWDRARKSQEIFGVFACRIRPRKFRRRL